MQRLETRVVLRGELYEQNKNAKKYVDSQRWNNILTTDAKCNDENVIFSRGVFSIFRSERTIFKSLERHLFSQKRR